MKTKIAALGLGLLLAASNVWAADASSTGTFKIGILTDLTGTLSDLGGPGTGVAAKLAIDDVGGKVLGRPIELLVVDHQNKADIGIATAREWFERRGVVALVDVMNSGIALGVNDLTKQYGKLAFYSAAATDRLSEDSCNGYGFSWNTDTYAQTNAIAQSQIQQGQDSWYVIVPDYAYGHSMQAALESAVDRAGGKVVGAVRHPLGNLDFSSYILQAQGAGAKVLAIASGGKDLVNAVKQVREFGLTKRGMRVVLLLPYLSDVYALGLDQMQGLEFIDSWYWDMDEQSRAFSQRFFKEFNRMPTAVQASVYSSTLQYLKAVEAVGSYEPEKVRAYLLSIPINDMFARNGKILPNGRLIHDVYSVRIKTPEESKGPWDLEEVTGTIPAEKAFRPLAESVCKIRN